MPFSSDRNIVTLVPSGDKTGATDDANFNAAVAALGEFPEGGVVRAAGVFYTRLDS